MMKQIIKNAIATCKKDGYNQVVYLDENNEYTFSRDYPSNNMYEENNVLGHVIGSWECGIYKAKYIEK